MGVPLILGAFITYSLVRLIWELTLENTVSHLNDTRLYSSLRTVVGSMLSHWYIAQRRLT